MASKYLRLAASLSATAAIGLAAVQVAADLEARREVRRIISAHPDLRIAAIRARPFSGTLVLEGIEVGGGPAGHIAIGRLTLSQPPIGFGFVTSARAESALDSAIKALGSKPEAEPPAVDKQGSGGAGAASVGGAAGAGAASAQNIVITRDASVVRIERIDLTGTALTNAELAALLDPNSGEPAEARLRKLTAASIVIPRIVVDGPAAGPEDTTTISKVTLTGVVAGKAARVSVDGIDLRSAVGGGMTTGSIGPIQGLGVDFTQAAHVVETQRTDDSEPIRLLFDAVTVDGIKVSDEKGNRFTLAAFKETGAKARPLKVSTPKGPKPSDNTAEILQDVASSFEVGSIETGAADMQLPKNPEGPMSFAWSNLYMRGYGKARFGGFGLRGVRFDSDKVKIGLASFDLGGFTLPKDRIGLGSANAMVPSAVKVAIDGLDFDVTTQEGAKGDQRVHFKVGHSSFASEGAPGEVPIRSRLLIENAAFDLPADNADIKPIIDMGYRHIDLSARLSTSYDAGAQELKIGDLALKGVDMGSISLGMHFLNVTKGIVSPKKDVQQAAAMAMLVKGMTLDVVNDGLVDRVIAWKAKTDGMSVDTEKADIIKFFDETLPAQLNSANVRIIGSAVAKFVAQPKTLHIAITSRNGLGAGSMALLNEPALLMDSLEVTATAK